MDTKKLFRLSFPSLKSLLRNNLSRALLGNDFFGSSPSVVTWCCVLCHVAHDAFEDDKTLKKIVLLSSTTNRSVNFQQIMKLFVKSMSKKSTSSSACQWKSYNCWNGQKNCMKYFFASPGDCVLCIKDMVKMDYQHWLMNLYEEESECQGHKSCYISLWLLSKVNIFWIISSVYWNGVYLERERARERHWFLQQFDFFFT